MFTNEKILGPVVRMRLNETTTRTTSGPFHLPETVRGGSVRPEGTDGVSCPGVPDTEGLYSLHKFSFPPSSGISMVATNGPVRHLHEKRRNSVKDNG